MNSSTKLVTYCCKSYTIFEIAILILNTSSITTVKIPIIYFNLKTMVCPINYIVKWFIPIFAFCTKYVGSPFFLGDIHKAF